MNVVHILSYALVLCKKIHFVSFMCLNNAV